MQSDLQGLSGLLRKQLVVAESTCDETHVVRQTPPVILLVWGFSYLSSRAQKSSVSDLVPRAFDALTILNALTPAQNSP